MALNIATVYINHFVGKLYIGIYVRTSLTLDIDQAYIGDRTIRT